MKTLVGATVSEVSMTYKIFALRYAGPLKSTGAFIFWLRDWDKEVYRNYYIWCLKHDNEVVVVDTGVPPNKEESLNLEGYRSVEEMLTLISVHVNEVRHVILTHLHFDHAGGIELFPNATFYVQKREYDFYLFDPVSKKAPFRKLINEKSLSLLRRLNDTGQVRLLEGEEKILPGICCVPAPGHTPGLQVVVTETSAGKAVLASDCGHFLENLEHEWPSSLICDLPAWLRSLEYVKKLPDSPDLLFPGHDPRLLNDYPNISPGIARLA